ncbi:TIGR01777 family oxidoreductase [Paenibacillus abyssi]|uniref:TIGR01777 family oxidoreductase n=1 Tax=Paenibacillus abyssi TaxID=1340531 RepID=UPI0036177566
MEQKHPKLHVITWEDMASKPERLEGVDAIVNLAGESINQRWTDDAKERILKSRLDAADRIAKLVRALQRKPAVVVNASGISIYGISETATFDENSPAHITDYLASVVEKWEKAADAIEVPRLVKLRVGLVLGNEEGAFPKMAMPYRFFGGGRVGSGKQWISWIHLEDMVRLITFCIDNKLIEGPVNASAPEPVTNDHFGRAIGRTMGRPHWFPVPAFLMKALFGELSVLLLEGQRGVPRKAMDAGFKFLYPDIDSAMRNLLGK